jgi:ABC-type sugar transport system substrate-binding protein
MQAALKYLSGLVFVGIVVQVALAGIGAFHTVHANDDATLAKSQAGDWFSAHGIVGTIVVLVSLVLLLVALAARDAEWRKRALIVFGLMVLQLLLAWLGDGVWALGFLHPLNALVLFAYTGMIAAAAWRGTTRHAVAPAA